MTKQKNLPRINMAQELDTPAPSNNLSVKDKKMKNDNKVEITTAKIITDPAEVAKYRIGKRIVMALWDKKGLNFLDPVYTTAEVNVIRNVQSDLKNEQKSIINQFPNDYEIWKLGYFEPDTGKFIESKEKVIDVEKLIEEKK